MVSAIKNEKAEAPKVSNPTTLKLWTKAGGRCSICNQYLLRDNYAMRDLNKNKGGHRAHIVARKRSGARGNHPLPLNKRSEIDNLILLCPTHHDYIDKEENLDIYTVEFLRDMKRHHEERIFELTRLGPNQKTKVVRLRARIDGRSVGISFEEIHNALFQQGRFPSDPVGIEIDLTRNPNGEAHETIDYAKRVIESQLRAAFEPRIYGEPPKHISVFALGPIPILVYLGSQLSDKIPTDIYQRHRDTNNWNWKEGEGTAVYGYDLKRKGTDRVKVVLILSLSGSISPNQLPKSIDSTFNIYEFTLRDDTPNPLFLRTPDDLTAFKVVYHQFLAEIRANHPEADAIHLFPAVPAPIAVMCGQGLLSKVSPYLIVYDNNWKHGGFERVLEVR